MRPLELEMTAFGSYAEKAVVPFEQLHQGLYLVAGDTGAGKTTIFDAVVFALYGRASGRDRSAAMLHSDYVEKSTDTLVKLRFEEGGKEYTVHRSIHFPRKKGTEGEFGDQQISALLEEPDREPTEGAEKVTRRIEELLGLNAEQFRKIVMLAQGEFREFLKADSDKKNEILGKLFDNSVYLRYQNLLSGARDELTKRRSALQEELKLLMGSVFLLPEGLPAEEAEGFLPGHPALLENLRTLTEREQEQMDALQEEQERLRGSISELDSRKGAAAEWNARFAACDRLERELGELEAREDEIRIRQKKLERTETALHRLRPFLDNRERAERSFRQSREELDRCRVEKEQREEEWKQALAGTQDDEKKQQRLRELDGLLQRTEDQLHRLQERTETGKKLALLRQEKQLAAQREEALAARCAKTEEQLEKLRQRLEELDGADALVLQRQGMWEQSSAREEALLQLQKTCAAILQEQAELRDEEEKLRGLAASALAAEQEHHRLYHALLTGQAGRMAAQLRLEIAQNGSACCPVCGSRVDSRAEAFFARDGEKVPSQDQVDKAKAQLDRAERARSEQDKRREALAARLQSRMESAVASAEKLLPGCGSWEELCGGGLETALQQEGKKKGEAEKALAEAKALEQERRKLRESRPLCEETLKAATRERESLKARLQELYAGEETLEALVREKSAGLLYPSEAEAEMAHADMLQEQGSLRAALEKNGKRLEQARSLRDTAIGSLLEKQRRTEELEQEALEALASFTAVLAETDFPDETAAREALRPAGEKDPAVWLREEQKTIGDWEAACLHKRRELQQQRESLQGKEPVDLRLLEEELAKRNAALSRCGEDRTRAESLLRNHLQVFRRAEELRNALARSERSWQRLERLGSLAAGMNSEGGRLSFDRYAMGAVFREILEMANRRMDTMSGGRYQLIHRSGADRRNAKAGLEIQVLDLSTGQLRSSESLSGGEGFFTSLSLALGLADVVQNRAGGRNLDALFIDEGFGSLSGGVLDKALEVLGQLTEGKRLVGIISHVEQLEESIPQKIRVKSGERGSSLQLEPA